MIEYPQSFSMRSSLNSASIGKVSKLEKMNQQGLKQPRLTLPHNELITKSNFGNKNNQISLALQHCFANNSNTQNEPFKDSLDIDKKSTPIFGNSYGIDNVVKHISLVKGVKLIHNGQIKKESTLSEFGKSSEILQISKNEFSKL
jgi:hypothetical protein